MDQILAMRVFVRVVERQGISPAARDLKLGQPTVSGWIDRLERHLGARLLERTTRSVRVTDAGLRFYERAREILALMDQAVSLVQDPDAALSGTLRICAPYGLGDSLLPRVVGAFQARYPQLRVDLILNNDFVEPSVEGVDLSLRVGRLGEGFFRAKRLGQIERVLVAAPGYLQRMGPILVPEDLVKHRFYRITAMTRDETVRLISPQGQEQAWPITTYFTCNHWLPLMTELQAGAGIGILHRPIGSRALGRGDLVEILPGFSPLALDVHALYLRGPVPLRRTQLFLETLEQQRDELFGPVTV